MHEGQGSLPVLLRSDGTSTFGTIAAEEHDHSTHDHPDQPSQQDNSGQDEMPFGQDEEPIDPLKQEDEPFNPFE